MKTGDVLNCQIQEWYPRFRKVTLKTEILPLPEDFVKFLQEDGIFLPGGSEAIPSRPKLGEWQSHSDEYEQWDENDDADEEPEVPTFPELEDAIRRAIVKLGGEVVPKLNWSSPKDVSWLSPSGSVKCHNAGEVILLLKGSDTITHDLAHAFDACDDVSIRRPPGFVLALRKWYDMRPEMEFRCFVCARQLFGACQRDVTSHYAVLDDRQVVLKQAIAKFFRHHIRDQFASTDYTFDVYVTRAGAVKLVDFNPWGGATLPLLFGEGGFEALAARALRPSMPPGDAHEFTDPPNGHIGDSNADHSSHRINQDTPDGEPTSTEVREGKRLGQGAATIEVGMSGLQHLSLNGGSTDVNLDMEGARRLRATSADAEACQRTSNGSNSNFGSDSDSELNVDLDFRIVTSPGRVQPGFRMASGVPLDLVDMTPGSAIDEFLRNLAEGDTQRQEE